MREPFAWDFYSDQPYQLKDKNFKKKMRKRERFSLVKTAFTALFVLPLSLLLSPFMKAKKIDTTLFFAMGVDFDKEPSLTPQLLQELGVEHILVRCKLWEMHRLQELKDFILTCKVQEVTVNVLQDREHIEDLQLLKRDLKEIFLTLPAQRFQIGSTINRTKWGFFSVDEYNHFFQVAYDLKRNEFQNIDLLGSGVIDFEYHFTAHTLFNFLPYMYDGTAALLYVDRRGAPENTQGGFNLLDKIAWLDAIIRLSPKSKNRLFITETNWPIKSTTPYAPTSEHECVDEESYADFLVRYYCLALASQKVDAVCWHQLIARGYGLIDNINGTRKRKAFDAFKTMVSFLQNSQFLHLHIKRNHYTFACVKEEQFIQIQWSLNGTTIKNEPHFDAYSRDGKKITEEKINISGSPIYLTQKSSI